MALEGNLKDFGLADILQLIFFQKKTGLLTIESKKDVVRISFVDGRVVMATSRRRPESARLGRMLVARGHITDSELRKTLQSLKGETGRALCKAGKVRREALIETVSAQLTDTVSQLFGWKEGRYEFIAREVAVDPEYGVSIDTEHLLMEGLRITDEWAALEGRFDPDAVYVRVRGIAADAAGLTPVESAVYAAVDGKIDAVAAIDMSGFGWLDAAEAVISLLERGMIAQLKVEAQPAAAAARRGSDTVYYIAVTIILAVMAATTIMNSAGLRAEMRNFKAVAARNAASESANSAKSPESASSGAEAWRQ
ncbi:MAG: DUF4388 domain-containing protein [Nitrospirae bacterium]|nr:DUF4388 domain-containing protein [Nitrospirota bacterium]